MALQQYDHILGKLDAMGTNIYIATGLHQRPHEHMTYYWRLKDHKGFMKQINLENYTELLPRMSRDFLVKFATERDAAAASVLLESFYMQKDGEKIFEVDNRGTSLFVELLYPNDVDASMAITNGKTTVESFKQYISFVAIKNGEHDGTGYLLSNNGLQKEKVIPLTELHDILKQSCLGGKAVNA